VLGFLVVALCVYGCQRGDHEPATDPARTSLLLIVVDALRPDHLGCHGYGRDTSPNIDRLAASSIYFTQAISQAPMTRTAMPSLLTSLYPAVHRVYSGRTVLPDGFSTLAETMRAAGYRTACFTASPHQKQSYNFYQGFDVFEGYHEGDGNRHLPAESLVDTAVDWVRQQATQPYLLYVHFMDVHTPWEVAGDELDTVCDAAAFGTTTEQRTCRYDRMIRYVDGHIAQLLSAVDSNATGQRPIVVLTSDHGEELGERGSWGHGETLFEEVIHVPLLVRLPHARHPVSRVDRVVRHVDVMPTVLAALGLEPLAPLQGVDLLSRAADGGDPELTAFSEAAFPKAAQGSELQYLVAVRDDRWKLLASMSLDPRTMTPGERDPTLTLYDLATDPAETVDVARRHPEHLQRLQTELSRWRTSCNQTRLHFEREHGVTLRWRGELDEETRKLLRSFGYVD